MPDENQFMRGFTLTVVMFALAHAASPYLSSAPQTTVDGVSIAVLMTIAYGLFLMATSRLSIEFLENVEQVAKKLKG